MGRKSGKSGKDRFRVAVPVVKPKPIDLEKEKFESLDEGVSISLKYFRRKAECFSDWQAQELKKFSSLIEKIKQIPVLKLQSYKPLCDRHEGEPAQNRFSKPIELSEDLTFYELKVDSSNAARVHGVFVGSVFFLVWLDRNHQVFPE